MIIHGGAPSPFVRKVMVGLTPVLDQVEGLIPDAAGPLLDAGFGLADIAFGAQLSSLQLAECEIDAARWPKIAAYRDWILGRPSFKEVLARAAGARA